MGSISQAIGWLAQGEALSWKTEGLSKCGYKEKLQCFLNPGKQREEVAKITAYVQQQLAAAPSEERQLYLKLADAVVARYYNSRSAGKVIMAFERHLARYRTSPIYKHPANRVLYQKWIRNGLPADIYHRHPECCAFLEKSGVLSQLKVTRDTVLELDGEAALIVEGKPLKWSAFQHMFEIQKSKLYKETFLVHKKSRLTYTYLDNGLGLQEHHPYLTGLAPISKLSEEDCQAVTAKAMEFVRPGEEHLSQEARAQLNAERPHVLQLVTSYIKTGDSHFSELVSNPKHPYLRLIAGRDSKSLPVKRGDVFEVGYGWKERIVIPFETTQGQFRSPDVWEYKGCDERIVTNIPVSVQEAQDFYEYTLRYHRDGIHLGNAVAFHLFRQNCSTYVRAALQVAGIAVPTEMTLPAVVHEVAPGWIRAVGLAFSGTRQGLHNLVRRVSEIFLPPTVKHYLHGAARKVVMLFQRFVISLTALGLAPIGIALGGALGDEGKAFVQPDTPEQNVGPPLRNWKNWLVLSGYTINLPGVLQRWQREQASTVVYRNPVKLSITP